MMADDRDVDEHLGAVLNEVLDAVYQSKQAAWSATSSPLQPWLRDLVSFLIEQSGLVMEAEESIGGRDEDSRFAARRGVSYTRKSIRVLSSPGMELCARSVHHGEGRHRRWCLGSVR